MRRPALASLLAATTALSLAFALAFAAPSRAAEDAVVIPAPAMDAAPASGIQTAVIAGGCFWGVQGVFQHTAGVVNAVSGYAGGTKATADYQTVSSGRTGHAEAVEIKYDPKKISYGKILQIYFSVAHDPTQLNRQGPDVAARNIARPSSPPPTSRRRWRRPISPSSTAPRSSASRS
ncbi:hypothetical protein ABH978_002849 [Bradyrhizobium ottawaense]